MREPLQSPDRRPLASRSTGWARAFTSMLIRANISPNTISLLSIAAASVGAVLLLCIPRSVGALLGAALCVQLRLLCNLLDGMVAIDGQRQSPVGALYNEIPDRIADSLLIVALGYAIHWPMIGWLGALAAAVTAYVRVLGGSLKLPQDFRGPMAKPQRMAVLTAACVIGAAEQYFWDSQWALLTAAWLIALGSMLTCVARTVAIARQLRAR